MSDVPSSSGTVPSADQAATSQHPAVPVTSLPLPPLLGPLLTSARQFVFPAEPSLVQQPPVVTHPTLVDPYPVVSQLHAYSSFAPPVYPRPRSTATSQDQFRYGMPHMPDFTATPVAPPPRAPTSFPTAVLVTPPPPPQDPLQANMVDTQSDLVDHIACLIEVVRRQVYWQMRQTESLMDTQQHLEFIWNTLQENAAMDSGTHSVSDENSMWSPIRELPEGLENTFTSPFTHQETTAPAFVTRSGESSFFHPYYTPTHRVSLENTNGRSASSRRQRRRRIPCRICHQEEHITYFCPRRHRTGCYLCGDPNHRMKDCAEIMNNSPSLPPPQTMCDQCGQPAHLGDTCGP